MRDVEQENRLTELLMQYDERFGVEERLCNFSAPAEYEHTDKLIELYERCLREDKPVSAFVETADNDVIY